MSIHLPFPLNRISTQPLTPHLLDDITLLALVVFGEAEGETAQGKQAVACVVRNRVNKGGWWGNTYKGVMLKTLQFSCLNEKYLPQLTSRLRKCLNDPKAYKTWAECYLIAHGIYHTDPWSAPIVADNTRGATHYHTKDILPAWAQGYKPCATIGNHLFYNTVK